MSSLTSGNFFALALFGMLVAGMQTASASVMQVRGASFEVSAQVIEACIVDTGSSVTSAATTSVSCGHAHLGRINDSAVADLPNPTTDEVASPDGTRAVVVVY